MIVINSTFLLLNLIVIVQWLHKFLVDWSEDHSLRFPHNIEAQIITFIIYMLNYIQVIIDFSFLF